MDNKSILVIEDNHELAESLEDMLTLSGYDAHIELSGREGLSYALDNHPDLTILDIRLPDINGYEVYRGIREDSWGKDAKVSILTASESLENISKNINMPKENILFKPDQSVSQILRHVMKRLAE